MSFVVLVYGGRDYADRAAVYAALDEFLLSAPNARQQLKVVSGGATGADALAIEWAKENRVAFISCPADWARHGRAAGPIRNQAMLDTHHPDWALEFPGGRGTADMRRRCLRAGVEVEVVRKAGSCS